MPAVQDLLGLRGTNFNTRFVFKGTVTTNELDLRMFLKPITQGGLGSVRQQFNRSALLQIDQDRAIPLPLLGCPIINSQDSHSWLLRKICFSDQTENTIGAHLNL